MDHRLLAIEEGISGKIVSGKKHLPASWVSMTRTGRSFQARPTVSGPLKSCQEPEGNSPGAGDSKGYPGF